MKPRPKPQPQEPKPSAPPVMHVQNQPPQLWPNFDACWNACVKNGTPFLLNACKEHLKSKGWLNDKSKWIEGIKHFGIKVEA